MYLEISARRMGKTKRLREAVKKHLNDGGEAIVVVPHLRWFDFMGLPENEPKLFVLHDFDLKEEVPNKLKGLRFDNPRWFFEEFDFLENILRFHIMTNKDGYYVTTPRFIRKISEMSEEEIKADVLLTLLNLNKGKYVAYTHDAFDFDRSRLVCEALGEKHCKTQLFGNIF